MARIDRQELVLGFLRPVLVAVVFFPVFGGVQVMLALHLLQKHHVGIEQPDRLFERMHPRLAADGRHALVDVVSGYADFHEADFNPEAGFAAQIWRGAPGVLFPPIIPDYKTGI